MFYFFYRNFNCLCKIILICISSGRTVQKLIFCTLKIFFCHKIIRIFFRFQCFDRFFRLNRFFRNLNSLFACSRKNCIFKIKIKFFIGIFFIHSRKTDIRCLRDFCLKRSIHIKILHGFRNLKLRHLKLCRFFRCSIFLILLLFRNLLSIFFRIMLNLFFCKFFDSFFYITEYRLSRIFRCMDHRVFRLKLRNIRRLFLRRNIFDHFFLHFFCRCLRFFLSQLFAVLFFLAVENITDAFGYFFLKAFCSVYITFINADAFNNRTFILCFFDFGYFLTVFICI